MSTNGHRLGANPAERVWINLRDHLLRWGPLVILAWLAWRSINYFSGVEPGPDSSIFLSMAWHANTGQILYHDVWDHKPPMIFFLNGLAIAMGSDGINSVRAMERIFALLGVLAFAGVVYLAFRRWWLACLAGVPFLLHFYALHIIEHGNITEEYGAVFVLLGMLCVLWALQSPPGRAILISALAGASFSAAVLTKEPFVLIAPVWLACLAWGHDGHWQAARRRAAAFLIGALLPGLLFLIYLFWHGA